MQKIGVKAHDCTHNLRAIELIFRVSGCRGTVAIVIHMNQTFWFEEETSETILTDIIQSESKVKNILCTLLLMPLRPCGIDRNQGQYSKYAVGDFFGSVVCEWRSSALCEMFFFYDWS